MKRLKRKNKGFCVHCHEAIIHNGYDWEHEKTGLYGLYTGEGKNRPLAHVATFGGKSLRKSKKTTSPKSRDVTITELAENFRERL